MCRRKRHLAFGRCDRFVVGATANSRLLSNSHSCEKKEEGRKVEREQANQRFFRHRAYGNGIKKSELLLRLPFPPFQGQLPIFGERKKSVPKIIISLATKNIITLSHHRGNNWSRNKMGLNTPRNAGKKNSIPECFHYKLRTFPATYFFVKSLVRLYSHAGGR